MELKDYLMELRKYSKLSREKLASFLDVSPSLVYDTEVGRRHPSIKTLRLYSDFFQIPFDLLLDFKKNEDINILGEYKDVKYVISNMDGASELLEPNFNDFIYNAVPHYSSIEHYIAGQYQSMKHLFLRKEFETDLNKNAIWTIPYFGEEVNQLFLSTDVLVINSALEIQNNDLIVYQYQSDHYVYFGIRKYFSLPESNQVLLSAYSNNESIHDIVLNAEEFSEHFTVFGKIIFSFKTFY